MHVSGDALAHDLHKIDNGWTASVTMRSYNVRRLWDGQNQRLGDTLCTWFTSVYLNYRLGIYWGIVENLLLLFVLGEDRIGILR